jgi:hypothetical protein
MSYSNYVLNERIANLQATAALSLSKISSLQVPPTPNELVVVDTIVVADAYPLFNDLNTITPTQITIGDTGGLNQTIVSNNQVNITSGGFVSTNTSSSINFVESATLNGSLYGAGGIAIGTNTPSNLAEMTSSTLTMTETITNSYSSLGYDGFVVNDTITGQSNTIDKNTITMIPESGGFNQIIISNDISVGEPFIRLDDSLGVTNTLEHDKWTGNIQTVNTNANLVHYLNFSDSSGTGYGKPQKTANISCNPALAIISATTFSGNATSSSTSTGVNLTSDNTAGTYYLPFTKTVTATGNSLFIDNTTTPLTYNPSTSTLTCSTFSGTATNASNLVIASDNTSGSYYIPFSKTSAGTNPLYVDDFTSPLTYNPSTGLMSALYFSGDEILPTSQNTATFAGTTLTMSGASNGSIVTTRNSSVVITGTSNTIANLTITNTLVNGTYKIGILNSGTNNLTINTGLGTNIKTVYSGNFNVSSGRWAQMTIDVIIINAVTTYIVNAFQLTN